MTPEDQPDDELQKMLAMKRREVPPPKFFQGFSDRIIDSLHQPQPIEPPTLLQKLGLDFDAKPVLVCGSGIVVCALLVYGIVSSPRVEPPAPDRAGAEEGTVPMNRIGASVAPSRPAPHVAKPEDLPRSADPAFASDPASANRFQSQPKPGLVPPAEPRK